MGRLPRANEPERRVAAYEYGFAPAPGGWSRARSVTVACAAIAVVCVLSSTVVMRELVATQPARAAAAASAPIVATAATIPAAPRVATAPTVTAAHTWALEPRWWSGPTRQTVRPTTTATVPDNELTFTKGYQLRLAARQATQPATPPSVPAPVVATASTAERQSGRSANTMRKPSTLAHPETPIVHPVSTTIADPFARFVGGNRAMAYDEQRTRERGFPRYRPAPPPRGLFGTLY